VVSRGHILGLEDVVLMTDYTCTATVLDTAELYEIDRDNFTQCLKLSAVWDTLMQKAQSTVKANK
jgi:CRP-like cAMP-binding protein